jgi:hypothetical protein
MVFCGFFQELRSAGIARVQGFKRKVNWNQRIDAQFSRAYNSAPEKVLVPRQKLKESDTFINPKDGHEYRAIGREYIRTDQDYSTDT